MLLPFRVDQLRSESNGPQPSSSSQTPNTSRSASPTPSDLTRVGDHIHTDINNNNNDDDDENNNNDHNNNHSNGDHNNDGATLNEGPSMSRLMAALSSAAPQETLCVYIYPCAELPSIPYKLRFAMAPDEWDTRVQCIQTYTERAAKPILETLWFSVFCIAIPVGVAYPLYMLILDLAELDAAANGELVNQTASDGSGATGSATGATGGGKVSAHQPGGRLTREDKFYAILIPCIVSTLLFLLFLAPMLIRKYVLQRRVRRETVIWEEVDRKKLTLSSALGDIDEEGKYTQAEMDVKLQWRVRLPYLFSSACVIYIPIPPRTNASVRETMVMMQDRRLSRMMITMTGMGMGMGTMGAGDREDGSVVHTRQNSWDTDVEAHHGGGGGMQGVGVGVGVGGRGMLVRTDSFGGQSRFEREERGVY